MRNLNKIFIACLALFFALNIHAQTGPTGPTGRGYLCTSSTLDTFQIGPVPKVYFLTGSITSSAMLAYAVGDRVRVIRTGFVGQYMEGTITFINPNLASLTVTKDLVVGTPLATSNTWTITLTGNVGTAGATGAAGTNGATGATGAAGARGATTA